MLRSFCKCINFITYSYIFTMFTCTIRIFIINYGQLTVKIFFYFIFYFLQNCTKLFCKNYIIAIHSYYLIYIHSFIHSLNVVDRDSFLCFSPLCLNLGTRDTGQDVPWTLFLFLNKFIYIYRWLKVISAFFVLLRKMHLKVF